MLHIFVIDWDMRVNGKMKEHKEKEILIIKMEIDMKEILEMDHVKEKELFIGIMVIWKLEIL